MKNSITLLKKSSHKGKANRTAKVRDEKKDGIYVYGAREHNLKSLNVFIPRNKLTVVTGLSGSGKSSLVFDTIYAEGQRRYVESLSSYARFFISQMKKPDVDSIKGLSPAVAIDQRSINTSPRSTVGTVTEIYDYLRLLFAKLGTPYCPEHQKPLQKTSIDQIAKEIMKWPKGTMFFVLSPVAEGQKGEWKKAFERGLLEGGTRARVNGEWIELTQYHQIKLSKRKRHFIDILMDRLIVDRSLQDRLKESLQKSADLSEGRIKVELMHSLSAQKAKSLPKEKSKVYSLHATCPVCLKGFPVMEPKLFSFNNPKGACPFCHGLGYKIDEWASDNAKEEREVFEKRPSHSEHKILCPHCQGLRLKPFALNVKIKNKNIAELSAFSIAKLYDFCHNLQFLYKHKVVAEKILEPIQRELSYLKKIGLSYLSLNRSMRSLSGGEAQRIRLISQISSPLIGALYVLDEPSIGLHPKDQDRLLNILFHIRDRGNTILMVEHDEKSIRSADHIIDLGPLAGQKGGHIIAKGSLKDIMRSPKSRTGWYLSGYNTQSVLKGAALYGVSTSKAGKKQKSKSHFKKWLEIKGAQGYNLKKVNVQIPIGSLTTVTGVSGSGKSTLIMNTLYKALLNNQTASSTQPLPYKDIKGTEFLNKVVAVNQKPIGTNSRSVPATYVGLMSPIRALMAGTPSARVRGWQAKDFSFNVKGGRCENCLGTGQIKQEMFFLPTAVLPCDVCQGRRYSEEILNVCYKGKNIHDILSMEVSMACRFFAHHFLMKRELELLEEVGLGYLTLGQSAVTLSGGEAQRIKLTRELARKSAENTLYILDEPTTGLHFQDVENLLLVLKKLRDKGGTVIVIEQNMDIIKSADYIIDLGPGGGIEGGQVVAKGRPRQVAKSKISATAPFLRLALKK